MSKIKVSNGLGTILLLGSLFAGWQTLLIVTALLLIFGEVNDDFKAVVVRVVTFYIGLTIVSVGWDLLVTAVDVVFSSIDKIIATINGYLDASNLIDITKLKLYLFNPIQNILDVCDNIVGLLISFTKLMFIVGFVSNKTIKDNIVTRKINEYVTKVVEYVNSIDFAKSK